MKGRLLEQSFTRTTLQLTREYGTGAYEGYVIDAWVFDDEEARREAETALCESGVTANIRSAYKPLVHFILEELPLEGLDSVSIEYPVLENSPRRFLLEAYPASALLTGVTVSWQPKAPGDRNQLTYSLVAQSKNGSVERYSIVAPNKLHEDETGQEHHSPCGWLRLTSPEGVVTQVPLTTDYELIYDAAMTALKSVDWKGDSPYFEELNFAVNLPAKDRKLDYGHECISLAEALHEDLYFSALEYFQQLAGLPLGDRTLSPGQIVPEIRITDTAEAQLCVECLPLNITEPKRLGVEDLGTAPHALGSGEVAGVITELGGKPLRAMSRAGRTVSARYISGSERPVMISAAQHANETSGVVGALRAAQALSKREQSHFVISPLENPDGYAVQGRLTSAQPHHMHHAARYTAFGNDLESQPRGGQFEHSIREQAHAMSGAQLHLNLHGYPSHEWTRPSTGYIPRGFEMWTVPKGFFLIVRYHSDWQDAAMALLDQVTQQLSKVPGLMDFNRRLIELFGIHAGNLTFPIRHGFPFVASEDNQQLTPLMLITEYPDETLTGDAFVQAHTAQMNTVLAAYEAFQTLTLPTSDK